LYLGAALDFSSSFFLALSDRYLDKNWSSTPLSRYFYSKIMIRFKNHFQINFIPENACILLEYQKKNRAQWLEKIFDVPGLFLLRVRRPHKA